MLTRREGSSGLARNKSPRTALVLVCSRKSAKSIRTVNGLRLSLGVDEEAARLTEPFVRNPGPVVTVTEPVFTLGDRVDQGCHPQVGTVHRVFDVRNKTAS